VQSTGRIIVSQCTYSVFERVKNSLSRVRGIIRIFRVTPQHREWGRSFSVFSISPHLFHVRRLVASASSQGGARHRRPATATWQALSGFFDGDLATLLGVSRLMGRAAMAIWLALPSVGGGDSASLPWLLRREFIDRSSLSRRLIHFSSSFIT
jgi:hypothetical protein